ncbi:MAG: hypothetical protein SFU57_11060 [Gemmatimonadales bacterium]|nr:hypothetical protein [Gemmatimonadales bacterium]
MTAAPRLSVVLAAPPRADVINRALTALQEGLPGETIELLLTGSPPPTVPDGNLLPSCWHIRHLATDPKMLVPEQWGVGLRHASAPLIAFFSGDTVITPDWWPAVATAIAEDGVAGVATGIALLPTGRPDAAVFLARYSTFLPQAGGQSHTCTNLPGEATVYRRAVLTQYPELIREGFWEIRFHQRMLAEGWRLRFLPQPLTLFHAAPGVVAFMQQRCGHAQQFGAERVRRFGQSRLGITVRAPLVPWVMLGRILRRAIPNRWGRRALRTGLPRLILYLMAWSWGEVLGAWRANDENQLSNDERRPEGLP